MKTIIALLMLSALCGCGGGSDEEDRAGTMPVDCKTEPKRCT